LTILNSMKRMSRFLVCMLAGLAAPCVLAEVVQVASEALVHDGDGRRQPLAQWTFDRKVSYYTEQARARGQGQLNDMLANRVNRDVNNPDIRRVKEFLTQIRSICAHPPVVVHRVNDASLRSALLVRGVEAVGEAVQATLCNDLATIHCWIDHWQQQLNHPVKYFLSQWPHRWINRLRSATSHETEIRDHIRALGEIRDCYRRSLGKIVIALDKFDPACADVSTQYAWMAHVLSQVQELCEGSQEVAPTYESMLNTSFKIVHALEVHPRAFNAQIAPHVHGFVERWYLWGALGTAATIVSAAFAHEKVPRWCKSACGYAQSSFNELKRVFESGNDQRAEQAREKFIQKAPKVLERIHEFGRRTGRELPNVGPEEHENECVELRQRYREFIVRFKRAREANLNEGLRGEIDERLRVMQQENYQEQLADQSDSLNLCFLSHCASQILRDVDVAALRPGLMGGGSPTVNMLKVYGACFSLQRDILESQWGRFGGIARDCFAGVDRDFQEAYNAAIQGVSTAWESVNKITPQVRALTALVSTLVVGLVGAGTVAGIRRLLKRRVTRYRQPAKNALDEITAALLVCERDSSDPRLDELDELAVGTLIANAQIFGRFGRGLVPEGMRATFDGDIAQLKSTAGARVRAKIRWVKYMRARWGGYLAG